MDKNKICEAMYALPGDVVVRRRKSFLVPAVMTLVGAALIVVNNLYGSMMGNNLSSAVIFVGGVLTLIGIVMVFSRLFGSDGVPFYRNGRSYLRYDELYFEHKNRGNVLERVEQGAVDALLTMPRSQVPIVTVALYRTSDNRFAAMQAFEYSDLEYKPLTELKFVGV